jgi:nucleotide-binding universal stress UspA family protein
MNAEIKHILAPTDLSDSGIAALRYARLFAEQTRAKLTLLYSDPVLYPVDVLGESTALFVTMTPEHEARLRTEVEQHAEPIMRGLPYHIAITIGQPVPMILRATDDLHADLIIIGTHARHGWRRAVLGSVSEGVLHGSHVPVMTVSSHDHRPGSGCAAVTRILCPVNFSEVARESVGYAGKLAEKFGAELIIVNVIEVDEPSDLAADERRVRTWIAPALQNACSYRELVLRGGPAERVLDCADDVGADLLVIGAQHKVFREATVIGTTTERLVRFAPCPVLVVTRQAYGHDATVPITTAVEATGHLRP